MFPGGWPTQACPWLEWGRGRVAHPLACLSYHHCGCPVLAFCARAGIDAVLCHGISTKSNPAPQAASCPPLRKEREEWGTHIVVVSAIERPRTAGGPALNRWQRMVRVLWAGGPGFELPTLPRYGVPRSSRSLRRAGTADACSNGSTQPDP
jgi:hypothetical protein